MAIEVLQAVMSVNNTPGIDYREQVNEVQTITSGRRIQIANTASGTYWAGSVNYAPILDEDYDPLYALWKLCKAQGKGCLFWNRQQNQFNNDYIGTGDGSNRIFQLQIRVSAGGEDFDKPIQAPIHNFSSRLYVDGLTDPRDSLAGLANTVILTDDGVDIDYDDYTIDEETGGVLFDIGAAPAAGHVIRARDGYFLHCVNFPDSVWPLEVKDSTRYLRALRIQEVSRT